MSRINRPYVHGNFVSLYVDNIKIGEAQDVNINDDYGTQPQSGIGDIHAHSFAPSEARHTITFNSLILIKRPLRKVGIIPENGDSMLKGIEFDISIRDRDSGAEFRKAIGAVFASGGLSIQKHQVAMNSATFMARDVKGSNA